MKEDLLNFILWMYQEKNKVFIKNGSSVKIAQLYNKETGSNINHAFVLYHRFKWILINGKPYEKAKIPLEIFNTKSFAEYAKLNNIVIDDLEDDEQISIKDIDCEDLN